MERIVEQRIRNRIIESLEMFIDDECISKFGSDEIIEIWFDWVDDEAVNEWGSPVFTRKEIEVLKSFHLYLDSIFKEIPSSFDESQLKNNKNWLTLVALAHDLYNLFMVRGPLSEE